MAVSSALYEQARRQLLEDPYFTRKEFCFPVDVIDKLASECPDGLALMASSFDFQRTAKISYAELSRRSHRAAVLFHQLGIEKGSRVMICVEKQASLGSARALTLTLRRYYQQRYN